MRKIVKMILGLVIFPTFSYSQTYSPWEKVDMVTSGDFDDFNPVLDRGGTAWYDSHPNAQWLVFERESEASSMIMGKRFFNFSACWDSVDFVISSMPPAFRQTHPDISTNSTAYSSADSTWVTHSVLAAWEAKSGNGKEIYYSRLKGKGIAWSPPVQLTSGPVDNSYPKVIPWNDSTFVILWRHGYSLVYSMVTPTNFSTPDTIIQSNLEDFKFDIISLRRKYITPGNCLVWSLRGEDDYRTLAATSLEVSNGIRPQGIDTLRLGRDAFDPIIIDDGDLGSSTIVFTSVDAGKPQTHAVTWNGWIERWSSEQPLFEGDISSNINLRGWMRTIIADEWPSLIKRHGVWPLAGFSTWENIADADTALVFRADVYSPQVLGDGSICDTVRTTGHNRNPSFGTYSFQILDKLFNMVVWESNRTGSSHIYSRRFVWMGTDAVDEKQTLPSRLSLHQNHPNPFNPSTTISFDLPTQSVVTLKIFNVLGQEVATLVDGKVDAGRHQEQWNAGRLASGVYFYRLQAGKFIENRKMILLR
jgi:hypothetical protein